jgi:hypothetical protein
VLRLTTHREVEDRSAARGRAMRAAREAAGLELVEAARRLNRTFGMSIFSAGLLAVWEGGTDPPDSDVFIEYVRMAGEAAAAIFASLA